MDKNIVAALIIGVAILLQPLVEESTKDYKWRVMWDRDTLTPNSTKSVLWLYSEEECEKQLAGIKRSGMWNGESCQRFPR